MISHIHWDMWQDNVSKPIGSFVQIQYSNIADDFAEFIH